MLEDDITWIRALAYLPTADNEQRPQNKTVSSFHNGINDPESCEIILVTENFPSIRARLSFWLDEVTAAASRKSLRNILTLSPLHILDYGNSLSAGRQTLCFILEQWQPPERRTGRRATFEQGCQEGRLGQAPIRIRNLILTQPISSEVYDENESHMSPNLVSKPSPLSSSSAQVQLPPGQKHSGDVMPGVYRAPEIIIGADWDSKIDLWSVGVMVRQAALSGAGSSLT